MKITHTRTFSIIAISLLFVLMNSCTKDNDFTEKDDNSIREYLQKNDLSAQKTGSGLYYIVKEPGSSQKPNIASRVTVHYKGYLLDGSEFECSYASSPLTFFLRDVITGWQEGLQLYGEGGEGTLLIPSHLAYGNTQRTGIPANSVLIFDIHLINIE